VKPHAPHETQRESYSPRAGKLARAASLWRHLRRLEREGHCTAGRQFWEIIQLRVRRGIGPVFYLRAGLYRRELSWRDKLEYVAGAKYERLIHRVNPPEHDRFTRNKLECYRILSAAGVPTPEVYGIVEGASGTTWDGEVLRSSDDLLKLLERLGTDTVCFKFVTGTRGRGFYKVKIDAGASEPMATIEPDGSPVEGFLADASRSEALQRVLLSGGDRPAPEHRALQSVERKHREDLGGSDSGGKLENVLRELAHGSRQDGGG
jgi:hypothetical protein